LIVILTKQTSRNFLRVISQLGIIAIGAGMLIIAGEFDLSIGSMIGFAGACMAMILRWGFSIIIPYISFDGGFHIEFLTLIHISDISPMGAIFITLIFTLFFGWAQGMIVVKSGLPSFIVTLGGLFFLRGLTEVSLRSFNHPVLVRLPTTTRDYFLEMSRHAFGSSVDSPCLLPNFAPAGFPASQSHSKTDVSDCPRV
jgi:ribose/xylose/arabinose/galactoside ABC-type transport system permease subunit